MTDGPAITHLAVMLVLASAVLHTAWNLALKEVEERGSFNAWMMLGCAVWGAPAALYWWAREGGPALAPVLLALATSVLWLIYYELLDHSYRTGDLSVTYPIIRGVSPLAAALLGALLGERASGWGIAGIGCIVAGVWLLSGRPLTWAAVRRRSILAPVAGGLVVALYSVFDGVGVKHCPPLLYIWLAIVPAALQIAAVALRRRGWRAVVSYGRAHWWTIAWTAWANYISYVLVLVALTQAQVMYVVPLRAAAVLFSVLAGAWRLGERDLGPRLVWAAILVAGIAMLALGG